MPYKKRSPKKKYTVRRKRIYRKKRSFRKSGMSPNKAMGFPTQRIVKMRYVTPYNLNAGIGALAYANFRANSVYDPDAQAGGHQAMGFDQWSQFYSKFVVIGSKLRTNFIVGGNDAVSRIQGVYLQETNSSPPGVWGDIIERGKGSYRISSPSNNGPSPQFTLMQKFSAKKWFNLTNIKDNWEDVGHSTSTNPNREAFFTVWVGAIDQSQDPLTSHFVITIDYLVLCSEPRELATS